MLHRFFFFFWNIEKLQTKQLLTKTELLEKLKCFHEIEFLQSVKKGMGFDLENKTKSLVKKIFFRSYADDSTKV